MVKTVSHPLKPLSLLLPSNHNIPAKLPSLSFSAQNVYCIWYLVWPFLRILCSRCLNFVVGVSCIAACSVLVLFYIGFVLRRKRKSFKQVEEVRFPSSFVIVADIQALASIKIHLKPPMAAHLWPTPSCLSCRFLAVPILPLSSLHHPHTRPGRSQISIDTLGSGSPAASHLALRRRPTRVHSGVKVSLAAQVHTERVFRYIRWYRLADSVVGAP
ncbi:hypothetical protein K438DRAFT_474768 [Mycena galopus ATCC 62051]|nr:hypothetical protein K438DRAFT_474768 [Mycena galopus ATCC 62051]